MPRQSCWRRARVVAPKNQPAPDPTRELTTPDILVSSPAARKWYSFGPASDSHRRRRSTDGSVLFTEQDANKIIRIDPAGNLSTYLEDTNRTVGLAYDSKGRLIAAQSREPRIGVLSPTRTVLADSFEGQPLVRPNDLVIDKKGGIYFSDPIPNAQAQFRDPPADRCSFYITPAEQGDRSSPRCVTTPNGVRKQSRREDPLCDQRYSHRRVRRAGRRQREQSPEIRGYRRRRHGHR